MIRICLVTDELYPFTPGGIGRLLHNLVQDSLSRSNELEFHFLLPAYCAFEGEKVSAHFGGRAVAHYARMREGWEPSAQFGSVYPPAAAFTDSDWHAQSLDLMLALKQLQNDPSNPLNFDVIEFPDYRGWAYCTLQEKLLGRDFQRSLISVRLHATDGVLQRFELREPSLRQAARAELERKSLLDAELVVAHLESIADFNALHYGFNKAWRDRVLVEFPPVLWPSPQTPASPLPVSRTRDPDLLFVTKLQPLKAPDVFIRAAAGFLRARPDYQGRAILACHAMDGQYAARLRSMIPAALADRFLFLPGGPERDALIPGSVVVIPSLYESLNLTAYEASALGARLVLNGACPAFDSRSPWKDAINCTTFDGTVEGLETALSRAADEAPPEQVSWKVTPPYWLLPYKTSASSHPCSAAPPLVSVVITNYNLAAYLPEALASISQSTWGELEVIVVDDASTEKFDREALDRLSTNDTTRLIRNEVNRGLSSSRNIGIRAAHGQYILPLDADDCISPRFIELAVTALESLPQYDFVVPTCGYFDDDASLAQRRFSDYAVFLGDAPSLGLVANRLSTATSLFRREIATRLKYDETLDAYEDWSFYLRAAHAGHRFLVTNDVHFFYRRRPGSMISGVGPERHLQLLERIYWSLGSPLPISVQLSAILAPVLAKTRDARDMAARLVASATPNDGLRESAGDALPPADRYVLFDAINDSLKHIPFAHPVLRRAGKKLCGDRVTGAPDGRPLRYDLADDLNDGLKQLGRVHSVLKALFRAR